MITDTFTYRTMPLSSVFGNSSRVPDSPDTHRRRRGLLQDEWCSPKFHGLKARLPVSPNVTVLGDQAFKEVIQLK